MALHNSLVKKQWGLYPQTHVSELLAAELCDSFIFHRLIIANRKMRGLHKRVLLDSGGEQFEVAKFARQTLWALGSWPNWRSSVTQRSLVSLAQGPWSSRDHSDLGASMSEYYCETYPNAWHLGYIIKLRLESDKRSIMCW